MGETIGGATASVEINIHVCGDEVLERTNASNFFQFTQGDLETKITRT